MERRYDWIFFDAGGTLFQTPPSPAAYERLLVRLFDYSPPPGTMCRVVQKAREGLGADHVGPPPNYRVDTARARVRWERYTQAMLNGLAIRAGERARYQRALQESIVEAALFPLFDEVADVLAALNDAGYRAGMISNWDPRLDVLCRNHGLAHHFEFVLASEAEGFAKPGPHLFRRALELAGIEPGRAVHVGDSLEHDVNGASEVGIDAILLDRGGYYPVGRWKPTIRSLTELSTLI